MRNRVDPVVQLLLDVSLDAVSDTAREPEVGRVLSGGLHPFTPIPLRKGVGIDGSTRKPDDARRLPAQDGFDSIDLAIEYKLYRHRTDAAGEMDRGLGQCIAYAEQYEAVLFFVVYMGPSREPIPAHWLDRDAPLRVGHSSPGVPVYFAARPRSWNVAWAHQFAR